MVLHTTTEFFHEVYDPRKDLFSTNLHNFLWQLIINEAKGDKIIVFTPVYTDRGLEIGMVAFNETGYYPTYISFNNKDYNEAVKVCEELNLQLFGITDELAMAIVAKSMATEKVSEGDEEDEE
jgi:hypothetical protein